MKKQNQWFAVAGAATLLLLSVGMVGAQNNPPAGDKQGDRGGRGRGGFGGDPTEMRQRMMENIREQFGVKDDAEWKLIEERVGKVMDARRDAGFGGSGMGRMFRRPGGDNNNDAGGRRRFGPEPSAEEQALEKAIDSKASKEELKSAMAKYRASKKDKEAKVTAAQDDLKKVLNTQQEAAALSMGLVQ